MEFSFEYIITISAALYAVYLVNTGSPNINPFITYLLLPLLVAYITMAIINNIWPGLNLWGRRVYRYTEDKALREINDTGYIQLFPPIFIVLIIFALMLYNRTLG